MIRQYLLCLFLLVTTAVVQAADDARALVKMPAEARAALQAEMLDFQSALHQIVGALAEGKFADASNIADKQIGLAAMGRHRNSPANASPGMYMPEDMHLIARNMHGAASGFAITARSGDMAKSLAALQAVTGACVGCHRAYRTQ